MQGAYQLSHNYKMCNKKRPLPSVVPLITGCWKELTRYKPNLLLFSRSDYSPYLNLRFHAGQPKRLPSHQAMAPIKGARQFVPNHLIGLLCSVPVMVGSFD